ncbi:transcriptional regulator, ArsR family [Marinobacterium sediminicola]|uniref:Transcriptional regulator, ArsR family n=2 Tax=Marinobacterium sediminicola TaxID=518898 RepID=A0ABY1RVQ9_9GAMM|nr:transcriptional regulator, ArsR family [Marinobacterium sediminicola]
MSESLSLQQPQSPGLPKDSLELMKQNAAAAAKLMRVLGNDSRLLILCYLDGKELSVSELNRCLDLSQSALSQHLAVLRRDGLVRTRRESQTIFYSLNGDTAITIIRTLHELFCDAHA